MRRYETVKLGSREFTIEPEVYQTIYEMVLACLLCYYCGEPYTPQRPRVAQNVCLKCFMTKYRSYHILEYVGLLTRHDNGDETHKFIDQKGNIYLTTTTQDHKAEEYPGETLKHWGFQLPKKATIDAKEVEIYPNYLNIYGDVRRHSVLCVLYRKPYGNQEEAIFLCTKEHEATQINKRGGVYQQAKRQHEATKDARGYYHLNGREIAGLYGYSIYEVISEMQSTLYEALKRKEQSQSG